VIEGGCRLNLRSVRDPELRRRLTPPDSPMCKRQVFASGYYKALQRPNVSVVTDGIERAEPRGLVTRDGRLHELDVLVMATGFDSHAYLRPVELVGPDGTTLEDAWREGAYAYRTVALPGFPNFFMLVGPHSPVGTQSVVAIAEDQAHYIVEWIKLHMSGAYAAASPRHDATERYNAELREALPGTVWAAGCNSWYLGRDGLPELWPFRPERHTEMLREPHLAEFVLEPAERLSPAAQPVP
jgi:cation diffusion facilitator CzcD-associated flavoprotein CzcO